jgi:hypothetical protein
MRDLLNQGRHAELLHRTEEPVARSKSQFRGGEALNMMFDMARFGAEAWMVVGLRMARLAAGGPLAAREAQRMVTEKAAAAVEAQASTSAALMSGASAKTLRRKATSGYRRRVKANRRRLARRTPS